MPSSEAFCRISMVKNTPYSPGCFPPIRTRLTLTHMTLCWVSLAVNVSLCFSALSLWLFCILLLWKNDELSLQFTHAGPEEDSPTLMDFLEFVCHSPQSCHFRDSFRHNFEQAELWRGAGNLVHVAGSDSPRAGSHTGGCSPQHGNEGQLADGRPVAEEVPASAVSS